MIATKQWELLKSLDVGDCCGDKNRDVWMKVDMQSVNDSHDCFVNLSNGKMYHYSVIPCEGDDVEHDEVQVKITVYP